MLLPDCYVVITPASMGSVAVPTFWLQIHKHRFSKQIPCYLLLKVKVTVRRVFRPAWATNGLNCFNFGQDFAELFQFFRVSYWAESISPQYHTAGSHVTFPDPI